jgi:hypothetical protein
VVRGAAVHVRIGRVVPGAAVGVVVAPARRWVVIDGRTARGRRTVASPPVIIIVPTRGWGSLTVAIPVTIPPRAISTRRAAAVIVVNRGRIRATRRPRTGPIHPGDIRLRLFRGLANKNVSQHWITVHWRHKSLVSS